MDSTTLEKLNKILRGKCCTNVVEVNDELHVEFGDIVLRIDTHVDDDNNAEIITQASRKVVEYKPLRNWEYEEDNKDE